MATPQEEVSVAKGSAVSRAVFTGLGVLFLVIAIVGIFVPLVPTTITTIVAGYFLAKGSERFDNWLVNHRQLGPIIRDYRSGAGFTRRAKWIGLVAMTISIGASTWWALSKGAPVFVGYFMAAVWVYAVWFLGKQNTKPGPAEA